MRLGHAGCFLPDSEGGEGSPKITILCLSRSYLFRRGYALLRHQSSPEHSGYF